MEHVNLTIWIRVWHEEPDVSRDNSMDDDDYDDDDDDDSGAVLEQLLFFLQFSGSIICSFGYVLMCFFSWKHNGCWPNRWDHCDWYVRPTNQFAQKYNMNIR